MDNLLEEISHTLLSNNLDPDKTKILIQGLVNKELLLVEIIEKLGQVLVNSDKTIREHGMTFLTTILQNLPCEFLTEKELTFIVNFYCDRLKDHHNILPTVFAGLLYLLKSVKLPPSVPYQVLSHLQQNINIQGQLKTDRYVIYQIYQHCLDKYSQQLIQVGPDLVFNVISVIDGETDPFNLQLIFSFLPKFLKKFPLGHLTEEMFEQLAGYFPVDFNTAKKESITITRHDLSAALQPCLCSNPAFAEFCLPLIIEKLDSSLRIAKLDSYSLLTDSCNTFPAESYEKHLNTLWKMINKDLIPVRDVDVSNAAINSLQALIKLFSSSDSHRQQLNMLLADVVSSTKSLLSEPESNIFHVTLTILLKVCQSSPAATRYVLPSLSSYFIDLLQQTKHKKLLITKLTPFLLCGQKCGIMNSVVQDEVNCFQQLMDVFIMFTSSDDGDACCVACAGLFEVVSCLNKGQRDCLLDNIWNVLAGNTFNWAETRIEGMKILRQFSLSFPEEALNRIVKPHLGLNNVNSNISLESKLDILSYVVSVSEFTDLILPDLLNLIHNKQHSKLALRCLVSACKTSHNNFYQHMYNIYNIPMVFTGWTTSDVGNEDLLLLVTELIESTIVHLDTKSQQQIMDDYLRMNVFKNDKDMDNSGSLLHQVIILEAIMSCINTEVNQAQYLPELYTQLLTLALHSNNEQVQQSCYKTLSYLVNKLPEIESAQLVEQFINNINIDDLTSSHIQLLIWFTKSINYCGSVLLDRVNKFYFQLLARIDCGQLLADGFKIIFDESPSDVYKYPNKRLLYKQRLFTYCSSITESYNTSSPTIKHYYKLAVMYLMKNVPKFVYLQHITNYVSIITDCLLLVEDNELVLTCVTILQQTLQDKDEIMSEYVNTFLPKLLSISTTSTRMQCRIAALKCVYLYGYYPTHVLLPHKNKVVQELLQCVDDRKRLVRGGAVKARSRWFLVGAPGEEGIFNS